MWSVYMLLPSLCVRVGRFGIGRALPARRRTHIHSDVPLPPGDSGTGHLLAVLCGAPVTSLVSETYCNKCSCAWLSMDLVFRVMFACALYTKAAGDYDGR